MPRKKPNIVGLATVKSEKKNSENFVDVSNKKVKNFPATGPRERPVKILPSHRAIFQHYKDGGFKNMGKAVRQTKVYSEGVALRPHNITKSKSWQALMSEHMPEEHLAMRHAEILDMRDTKMVEQVDEYGNINYHPDGRPIMVEVDDGPNSTAVIKALDLAYKLKGKYKKDEVAPPSTVMYNLFYKPEVREQVRVFEDKIKQTLIHEIARKNQKDIEIEQENADNLAGNVSEYDGEGSGISVKISESE